MKVTRTTKARIWINENQFNRKYGLLAGADYSRLWIEPWTKEIEQEIERLKLKREKKEIAEKIRNSNLEDLSFETLRAIVGIIEEKINKVDK